MLDATLLTFRKLPSLNQPIKTRKLHQPTCILRVCLLNHFLPVRIHGVKADEEFVGDVFAAVALGNEFDDFQFSFA